MIAELQPKTQSAYRGLPVFGGIVDAFATWCHREGFNPGTIRNQLKDVKRLAHLLEPAIG